VVFCHPTHESFAGEMLRRTLSGLSAGGHDVRLADLYADGFRPELTGEEQRGQLQDHRVHPELRTGIEQYVADLQWCDALVLVYPTWWSGQPAMMKGWFDRVLVRGVAWDMPEGATRIHPMLRQVRRVVAVTSHGSSKRVNMIQGEAGKRIVTRAVRAVCSQRCRTRWVAFYDIDRADLAARTAFLDRIEQRVQRL
jgi:putative NADPH-quinone reductase